jgi:hypothetical protein
MSATMTIAERRVDEMQEALITAVRALDRLKAIEADLAEIREALNSGAEAIYTEPVSAFESTTRSRFSIRSPG